MPELVSIISMPFRRLGVSWVFVSWSNGSLFGLSIVVVVVVVGSSTPKYLVVVHGTEVLVSLLSVDWLVAFAGTYLTVREVRTEKTVFSRLAGILPSLENVGQGRKESP